MVAGAFVAFAAVSMTFVGTSQAQSLVSRYVAGQDYFSLGATANASPTADRPARVTEFFLYSCPHCYHFEPALERWAVAHDKVELTRVPVLFGPGAQSYARLYYTEQALGVTPRLHMAIFKAIHEQGRPLVSRSAQRRFMVAHGVDGARFDKAYDSPAVDDKIRRIGTRMRNAGIRGVPSMTVAGRYRVSGQSAGSNERMLDVVDYLLAHA